MLVHCIHPCRIGAVIASRGAIDPDRFNRFGYYMGAAFQIQDDLLNLVADESRYGKEIGGDIWEGKRTLMLIHMYRQGTPREQERVHAFLATPREQRTEREVTWVRARMDRYGSLDHARGIARSLAEAALDEFHAAYRDAPASRDKRFIEQIVHYMIERDL